MSTQPATPPNSEGGGAMSPQGERDKLIRQAELVISNVLRGGVLVSAAIIVIGVAVFYARWFSAGSGPRPSTTVPRTLAQVGSGLAHGDAVSIIALGLLVLLATPFIRVAVSIVTFVIERDWTFTVITIIVLAILIVSFVLGKGGA